MEPNCLLQPKRLLFLSFLPFFIWLIMVLKLQATYVSAVESDALAMINILFPYFWIILTLLISICLYAFYRKDSPSWLHVILLVQLSLMLYYTPFLLGGFSWSPDSLWHGGVAEYIPALLTGSKYVLTDYGQSYPLSFLVTYGVEKLLQVNIQTYSLYIFPPLCIALFSSLAYLFLSRISNKSTAFIAMLLALPALHYFEPHVSPFATGTVLLLVSLLLLTYTGTKAAILNLLVIAALVLTHPVSPIFLGLYVSSVLLVSLTQVRRDFLKSKATRSFVRVNVVLLFVFLIIFWSYWTFYKVAPNYVGVKTPVANILNLNFITNLVNAVEWTAGGQGFIYPLISHLSLFIYALFMVGVLAVFVFNLFKIIKKKDTLTTVRIELALTAILSAAMSYLLFSSSGERFLLGRGLIFFLLLGSACIATYISRDRPKRFRVQTAASFVFILFLVCTFPIIAYSKEAYNTFTPPAETGLVFISTKVDLSNKTISMTSDQQLASYADLTKGLNLVDFPPNLTRQKPDLVVMRINSYYFIAMRYDLSFFNNSYTALYDKLADDTSYNRIYSNSQFEVYIRPEN
jgi:hypothetical protein